MTHTELTKTEETLKVYATKTAGEYVLTFFDFDYRNLCEAKDKNGRNIGCQKAGCYSLENRTVKNNFLEKNEDVLLEALSEKFAIYGVAQIKTYEEYAEQDFILYNETIVEQFNLLEEEKHVKAKYRTFWNGQRFVSVFIDDDNLNFEGDLKEINEEEKNEILNDLHISEIAKYTGNSKIYRGKKYEFIMSFNENAWQTYSAYKIENNPMEAI